MSYKNARRIVLAAIMAVTVALVGTAEEQDREPGLYSRLRTAYLAWAADTDIWFHVGGLGAYFNLQDTRMTPLVYSGFGGGAFFCDELVRERWLLPTTVVTRLAAPEATDVDPGSYMAIAVDTDTVLLYRLPRTGVALGGGVAGGTNVRILDKLENSATNFDVVVSLSGSAQWTLPFTIRERDAAFHVRVTAPLFSYVGRSPEYSLGGYTSYWAAPWEFFRVTVDAGLTIPMRWSNENTVRLLYRWDFYGMDEFDGLHSLRIATHTLGVSFGLKRM